MTRFFVITFSGRPLAGIAARWLAALAVAGCVIIPTGTTPIRDIPPEQRDALTIGEATRTDVLMRYGVPDLRLEGDRILVYRWNRRQAAVVLIVPPTFFPFSIEDVEALFLEFDNRGRLARTGMAIAREQKTIAEQAAEWARGGISPPSARPPAKIP